MSEPMPTLDTLRNGAVLAMISEAVWRARCKYDDMVQHVRWMNPLHGIYTIVTGTGPSGSVLFLPNEAVGVLSDSHSPRFRANPRHPALDGVPEFFRQIISAARIPVESPQATAVFWTDQGRLLSNDTWAEFQLHSAGMLKAELMPTNLAMKYWSEDLELESDALPFILELFERKQTVLDRWMDLTPKQTQWLYSRGGGAVGLSLCRKTLSEIQIYMPGLNDPPVPGPVQPKRRRKM